MSDTATDVIGVMIPINSEPFESRYAVGLEELYQRVIESPDHSATFCQAVESWRTHEHAASQLGLQAELFYLQAAARSQGKNELERRAAAYDDGEVCRTRITEESAKADAQAYRFLVLWLHRRQGRRDDL